MLSNNNINEYHDDADCRISTSHYCQPKSFSLASHTLAIAYIQFARCLVCQAGEAGRRKRYACAADDVRRWHPRHWLVHPLPIPTCPASGLNGCGREREIERVRAKVIFRQALSLMHSRRGLRRTADDVDQCWTWCVLCMWMGKASPATAVASAACDVLPKNLYSYNSLWRLAMRDWIFPTAKDGYAHRLKVCSIVACNHCLRLPHHVTQYYMDTLLLMLMHSRALQMDHLVRINGQ